MDSNNDIVVTTDYEYKELYNYVSHAIFWHIILVFKMDHIPNKAPTQGNGQNRKYSDSNNTYRNGSLKHPVANITSNFNGIRELEPEELEYGIREIVLETNILNVVFNPKQQ